MSAKRGPVFTFSLLRGAACSLASLQLRHWSQYVVTMQAHSFQKLFSLFCLINNILHSLLEEALIVFCFLAALACIEDTGSLNNNWVKKRVRMFDTLFIFANKRFCFFNRESLLVLLIHLKRNKCLFSRQQKIRSCKSFLDKNTNCWEAKQNGLIAINHFGSKLPMIALISFYSK